MIRPYVEDTHRASRIPHCSQVLFLLTPSCPLGGREATGLITCLSRLSYLLLKSTGLLLKSRCSEIIDDIHHGPVCRVRGSPILHGTAKHKSGQLSWQSKQDDVPGSRLRLRGPARASSLTRGRLMPQRPGLRYPPQPFLCFRGSGGHCCHWLSHCFPDKPLTFHMKYFLWTVFSVQRE